MRSGFRACYQTGLASNRDLQGFIRLILKVGADGHVGDVRALVFGLDLPSVDCVLGQAAQGVFDPPEGGGAVIAVPVTFVKQ